MTAIVKVDGYPDRLACEACGCELAARREGEPWRYVQVGNQNDWTGIVEVDERPVHLSLDDGCHCHDSFLQLTRGNRYDASPPEYDPKKENTK